MRRRVLGLHRSRRGAYLIPCHKDLLRDVEFEQFCIKVVYEARDDAVDLRADLLDNGRVVLGEVEEVGEVRDAVFQRRFDEQRVNFLCKNRAAGSIVVGM